MCSLSCFSQMDYVDKINQYDDNNRKHGYWIEYDDDDEKIELYYMHGKKDGIFKRYSRGGVLYRVGQYKNDELSGTTYYFGDKGHLLMIQKDFARNEIVPIINSKFPYKCYTISFHPNGIKKSEGLDLWYDDPEYGEVYEYGKWLFYDESGKLIKTKTYK